MSERTEQPTPRRREESRRKGQVARSPEVAGVVSLLAGVLCLRSFGPWMLESVRGVAISVLSSPPPRDVDPQLLVAGLLTTSFRAFAVLLPVMGFCCVGAVAASLLQTGFLFSSTPLVPDLNRINPFQGFQRIFSLRGLTELVKPLLKLGLLAAVAYAYIHGHIPELASLSARSGLQAVSGIAWMSYDLLLRLTLVLALVAGIDYLFQRRLHDRSIRMTKEEVKEEYRRSEGDPQIKARIRRLQQQLARGRMMQQISRATVVVTNPTHLAVALRYEPRENPAPVVVAKGMRFVAVRIRERALLHRVPIVENPPLARALYAQVQVGQPVPMDLYQAVAEIIAFVYRLTGRLRARA